MCVCVCTDVKVRGQLCGVVLPFYVGLGGHTQVVRLVQGAPSPPEPICHWPHFPFL